MKAAMPSRHSGPSISMASASSPMLRAVVRSASPHSRTAIFDCATARGPSNLKRPASSIAAGIRSAARMNGRHEPMRQRFGSGDMAAEQNPFQRLAAADQPMHLLHGAGAGERPDPYFRHADPGMVRHQAEIASDRHFATAAERKTVDRGDHRDRQGLDAVEQLGDRLHIAVAQLEAAPPIRGSVCVK